MTNIELFDTLVSLYEHDISEYREVLLENGYELVYEDDVSSEEWETLDSFETFTDKLWEEKTMKNENITAEEYERIINEAMEEGMKIKVDSMAESIYDLGMAYLREDLKKPFIIDHRDRVRHDAMINNLHKALWYLKYGLEKGE